MNGSQLKALRGNRTREEFAQFLGGCSASTVNKWERDINPVPAWVAEKVWKHVPITLPLEQLHQLLDYAREHDVSFEALMAEALRDYLRKHRTATNITPIPQPDAAHDYSARVAEDPPDCAPHQSPNETQTPKP